VLDVRGETDPARRHRADHIASSSGAAVSWFRTSSVALCGQIACIAAVQSSHERQLSHTEPVRNVIVGKRAAGG
jgi:hypothetical protein